MAYDPVLFQAAATIVAGQIQANAVRSAGASRAAQMLLGAADLDQQLVEAYRKVAAAALLIADEVQAPKPGSQQGVSDISEPTA